MDNKISSTKGKNNTDERIQCHFISNTHWDREWRYSAQRTRYMLVYLIDMLFDIFEKDPEFMSFHLDSQTMPIQDYLEAKPWMEETVRKYVKEEKLFIGPWFCLPDEFCVGGESLIRNLLLGHRIAKKLGRVCKSGYSPFGWGQISQMPQIYKGFGIDVVSFYRGVNTLVAPRSEYIWEGPDGTQVIGSRLAARPRYNIWYVIQRPVYWDESNENNRMMSWRKGNGPFKFIDEDKYELDYQYAHPEFGYHEENIPERADQAIREQDNDWTTPHRFWSVGHDSSCPDIRESRLIADCSKALGDRADVFHSTIEALQAGIKANRKEDWPLVKGEMRHPFTQGSTSPLMGWIISARTDIKQQNFKTERRLTGYAEPMAVFASLQGAPYPQEFIDLSYNWLLQNHGHDSIGGCSRDIVGEDVIYRLRQSREISTCIIEQAMLDIVRSIHFDRLTPEDMVLVVFNPAPFKRTETVAAVVEIPLEWKCQSFEITDEHGDKLAMQVCEKDSPFYHVVQNPNDVANTLPSSRYSIRVAYTDIQAMGYRSFRVKPVKNTRLQQPVTMLTGPRTMENEFLSVCINSNGTYDIYDKNTGKTYNSLGYFRDSGEIGNPWQHTAPQNDECYTTLEEKAEICLIRSGELETSFRVIINWKLPEGRTSDDRSRSRQCRPFAIINTVTLRKGQPWIEIVTEVDNTVEDHYLQVSFPSGINADKVWAQGQFDVLERLIAKPDYSKYDEIPQNEHPMNSFVDINDGDKGLALLNEGLKAYEAEDDAAHTISLTLLRCFPMRICVTQEMTDYSRTDKGTQCPGKHSFRYAVMPHTGDWHTGDVWKASERFNLLLQAVQAGPTRHGSEPMSKSFLELRPDGMHVSAVKRSESGEGWIVRFFNPQTDAVKGALRLNSGFAGPSRLQSPVERIRSEFELPCENRHVFSKVRTVTLEEIPEKDLVVDSQGWVEFTAAGKKIITIEFIP